MSENPMKEQGKKQYYNHWQPSCIWNRVSWCLRYARSQQHQLFIIWPSDRILGGLPNIMAQLSSHSTGTDNRSSHWQILKN